MLPTGLRLALGFLTTLPTPAVDYDPDAFSRAGGYFPWVGLLLGVILAAVYLLLDLIFPSPIVAVLAVALWALLTGGLHLDGLADCCDGSLAPVSPQRRLEIMRDPRVGAFGAIGLILFLLLKVTAVAHLAAPLPALLLAATWSRWFLLLAARRSSARPDGMGAGFGAGLTRAIVAVALVAPILTLVIVLYTTQAWRGVLGVLGAWLVCLAMLRWIQARLGGVTGDVYGLVVEVSEVVILLAFVVRVG